jgi:putative ABC transport system ATP-binding protein
MEPIIKTRNVEVVYNLGKKNEFKAISDFSIDIYPGEFVSLFGPSGCGKSTIFYAILGVLKPSTGEMLVKGENPYAFSPAEMVTYQAKTIGIIYQAFFLIPSISVIDNVALPQTFMGSPISKRRKRAQELLDRFGVGTKSETYPALLSGGQSQRVSVARAMVNNPDILLADEPTGNLDSRSSDQVMDYLKDLSERDKKTVIMITHNAAQLHYCHRVFYMKDGKLLRVVSNPDKPQIAKLDKQKVLVTEIEILSKIYPYSQPEELKVKSIINYLTQDMDFLQLDRLEKATAKMIARKISRETFYEFLTVPVIKGGVGLTDDRAAAMSGKIEQILKQSEDVRRYRRRMNLGVFYNREEKLINDILFYIMEESKIPLNREKKMRLKQLVRDRVSGLIRKEELEEILKSPVSKKGLGFKLPEVFKVVSYFEKLLTQGVDTTNKS